MNERKIDWAKIGWWSSLGIMLIGLSFLFLISWSIRIDYWDGFAQLINAKKIVEQKGYFLTFRPLFVTLINTPIVALKVFGLSPSTILRLSHLMSFFIGVLFIIVVYLFLRESFSPGISIFSTLLFSLNRLFIHYVPFTMTDIPASLFYILSLLLYLKLKKKESFFLYTCFVIVITLALLTRLNMVLLPPTILLSEALISYTEKGFLKGLIRNSYFWKIFILLSLSCILFIFIHFVVLIFLCQMTFSESLRVLQHNYLPSFRSMPTAMVESFRIGFFKVCSGYLSIIRESSSLLVFILSIIGWGIGLSKRRKEDVTCFVWFILFFFPMSIISGHHHYEARYILPILFPIYYFCASFLELVFSKIQSWLKYHKIVIGLVGFLVIIPPMDGALTEYLRFLDPIYYTTFPEDVSEIAKGASLRGNKVYWWGKMYPLFPKDHCFVEIDKGFCIYHFNWIVVYFFSEVAIGEVLEDDYPFFYRKGPPVNHLFLKSGDVCVLSFGLNSPFVVIEVKRIELSPEGRYFKDGHNVFTLRQKGKALLLNLKRSNIKGGDLYLIGNKVIARGWINLYQDREILIEGIRRDEVKKIILIVPLIKAVFFPPYSFLMRINGLPLSTPHSASSYSYGKRQE